MATTHAGARRAAFWQAVFLVLGLLVFAGLMYGVGLPAILDALQPLGWLTPLIALPYFTSYFVDSIGWVVGSFEVDAALWLLGYPVPFASAFAIEALSGVAKMAAVIVPGSLGVQEGGQVLIFVAFGLTASLAVTFGLLRRGRELLWIGFGLAVLIHHHALGRLRGRWMAGGKS